MLQGKLLGVRIQAPGLHSSFFLAKLSIFRFSASGHFVVAIFKNGFFSPLPGGKRVFHVFLDCLLLFHPRAGVDLVLWGLRFNKLGVVLFQKKNIKFLT